MSSYTIVQLYIGVVSMQNSTGLGRLLFVSNLFLEYNQNEFSINR